MRQAELPPLGRSISSVVLGTFWMSLAYEAASFESLGGWLRLGGNVVDTAQ